MSDDEMKAELERLRNENAALKKGSSSGIRMKVSEKGAVSIYGMGRFPVTVAKAAGNGERHSRFHCSERNQIEGEGVECRDVCRSDRTLLCASPAAISGDGNQPADLWRSCRSVRGLVAEVAQCDMAIRKLLPELQSGSQRLNENPIFGFRLSVYFDDVAFAGVVSGEVVPHENHPSFAQQPSN